MTRRIVHQESVRYEAPPPEFGAWPQFETNAECVAWLREKFAAYPAYLNLVLKGGADFGAVATQGVLL